MTHILFAPLFPDEQRMSGGTHSLSGRNATGQWYGCAIDILPALTPAARRREMHLLGRQVRAITTTLSGPERQRPIVIQRQQLCSFLGGYRGVANGKVKRLWQRDPTIHPDEIRAVRSQWQENTLPRRIDACISYEALHRPFR